MYVMPLIEMGLLDADENVTDLGRAVFDLLPPVDRIGRPLARPN